MRCQRYIVKKTRAWVPACWEAEVLGREGRVWTWCPERAPRLVSVWSWGRWIQRRDSGALSPARAGGELEEDGAGPWGSRCEFHSPRALGCHVSLAWIMRPLDPMETDSPQILQLGACQVGRVGTHGYILVMLALRPLCSLRKKELSSLSPWRDWRVSSHETPWERIVLSLR